MPTTDTTLTLVAVHTLDDECPAIPEGASNWEAQELRRCWSNAIGKLHDTFVQAARLHDATRTRPDPTKPHVGGGGLTYLAMQADAAMVEYQARHDGVMHRLALAEREAQG